MSNGNAPVVGFIGLGAMGAPMASNILQAGFSLIVHDVRQDAASTHIARGARWAASPREVIEQCDVVITCLPSVAAIEAVAFGPDGLLAGAGPGKAIFETSTSSPDIVRRLHAGLSAVGAEFLDAPISGGAKGAQRGRLAVWVGGDRQTYDRYKPVLEAFGDRPVHIGSVGSGLTTKLVNNCVSQSLYVLLAEAFSLGVKAGADPLALWEAVRQGAVGSRRTYDGMIDEFLPGDFETVGAALRIMYKDMTAATALARELDVPMRMANTALADYTEAVSRGWAERDGRAVMQLPQERAGIHIAVDRSAIDEVLMRDPPALTDTKAGG